MARKDPNLIPGGPYVVNARTGKTRKTTPAEAKAYAKQTPRVVVPMKSRQMLAKERLIASGGKRISLNLPARVVERLNYRIERGDGGRTMSEVILYMLRRL